MDIASIITFNIVLLAAPIVMLSPPGPGVLLFSVHHDD